MKRGDGGQSECSGSVREPVDVVDGIPDRSRSRPLWKYAALAMLFLSWVGFLIYCNLAGKR